MFKGASAFNQPLNSWNTSSVTSLYQTFSDASSFNHPLDQWDTSAVTSLRETFYYASSFNQNIDSWDVSNVSDFTETFYVARVFNMPLNSWNTSSATTFSEMFLAARDFNQPLDQWNTTSVGSMNQMFRGAYDFNQDISSWDFRNVGSVFMMLRYTSFSVPNYDKLLRSFVEDIADKGLSLEVNSGPSRIGEYWKNVLLSKGWSITDWSTQNGYSSPEWTILRIADESTFTLPLLEDGNYDFVVRWQDGQYSHITSSNLTEATHTYGYSAQGAFTLMMYGTIEGFSFENSGSKDSLYYIEQWGNLSLTDAGANFYNGHSIFHIDGNDVPNLHLATNLSSSFRGLGSYFTGSSFANWDVSNVQLMTSMFQDSDYFDADLSGWNISQVTDMTDMFSGALLSTSYYDNMLIAWSQLNVQNNVPFHAGSSKYTNTPSVVNARNTLINTYGWTITDGGSVADTTAPTVSTPANITYYEGQTGMEITWSGNDYFPATYTVKQNGTDQVSGLDWTTEDDIVYNIDGLAIGTYNITIMIYDESNNMVANSVYVTVVADTRPVVDSPADVEYALGSTGNTIDWTISDTDLGNFTVYQDGNYYDNETSISGGTYNINIDNLALGEYEFTIEVIDQAGNTRSDTVTVTVYDSTAPTINQAPVDFTHEQLSNGTVVELAYDVVDASQSGTSQLLVNGTVVSSLAWSNGSVTYQYTTSDLGVFNITAVFDDGNGNFAAATTMVTYVDTTAPGISVLSNSTETDSGFYFAIDDVYACGTFEVIVDGVTQESGKYQAGYIYAASGQLGTYNYTVIVHDALGHQAIKEFALSVNDTTAPVLTIDTEITEFELGSSNNIKYNISDYSDTGTYRVYVNGSEETSGSWSAGSFTYAVTAAQLGVFNITVVAEDPSGNAVVATEFVTVVDTIAPVIVNNPDDLTYEEGTTGNTVSWTVTDFGADSYTISRNGTSVQNGTWVSNQALDYTVDGLSIGVYNFTVNFTDSSGHSVADSVLVTVTEPTTTSPTDTTTTDPTTSSTVSTSTASSQSSTTSSDPGETSSSEADEPADSATEEDSGLSGTMQLLLVFSSLIAVTHILRRKR